MRRIIIVIIVIVFAISCKSFPIPENENNTLLVIPMSNSNSSGESYIANAAIFIFDYETNEKVLRVKIDKYNTYTFTNKLKPGKYYIGEYRISVSYEGTYNGYPLTANYSYTDEINKNFSVFVVSNGALTILSESFGIYQSKSTRSHDSMPNVGFTKIESVENEGIQDELYSILTNDYPDEITYWEYIK